jgi:beta-glucanase (GH16 family)
VHSGHTHSPAGAGGPPKGGTAAIRRDDWNTYGARWNEDRIVFTVNGKATFTYPRVASKGPEQWPFNQPFYLIFSMQVGGDWVGDPEPDDYPAHLEIDWVRVYQKAGDTSRNPTGGQVPGS